MNINLAQADRLCGRVCGKSSFVTGHDFSRADCRPIELSALAAAKAQVAEMQQGLKPNPLFAHVFGTTEVVPCYKAFTSASVL
jgi:hypothetical protein